MWGRCLRVQPGNLLLSRATGMTSMFLCQDFNWKKKGRSSVYTVPFTCKPVPRQSFSHEGWAGAGAADTAQTWGGHL